MDAYTDLQSALQNASCAEIWVAAGTYTPTSGTDRTATFQLKNNTTIYGGFEGTEDKLGQWNFRRNVTILSGEIGAPGAADNSYHVVTGSGTDTTAALAGFTITAGNAADAPVNNGGGGVFNDAGSPTLQYLTFTANSGYFGGGMMNISGSSPMLQENTFSGNQATFGGGIYNLNGSNPTLMDVTIDGNTANISAGGIMNIASSPTLLNVTVSNNSAPTAGGMQNDNNSSAVLKNVTFSANTATQGDGGGLVNTGSSPEIRNTIFWGNTAVGRWPQIYDSGGAVPTVSDSVVQCGYAGGTNIIAADPYLGTLGNYGGIVWTVPLLPGSSAIDAGNEATCAKTDQRGKSRLGACDLGAFEWQGVTLSISDGDRQITGLNTAFAHPLTVTVTPNDPDLPVAGVLVTFTGPGTCACVSLNGSPVTVGADGIASVLASTNDTPGKLPVTASAPGAADVIFHLAILDQPSLSVTNSPVTYNGSPQAAIVVASAAGTVSNVRYNGSTQVPTEPGTYAVTADFASDNPLAYVSLPSAPAGDFVIAPVGPPPTTAVGLTAFRQRLFFGENWTLTAAVTTGAGTPSGTVTFKDGATILGTSDVVDGNAVLTINSLPVGRHTITAEYLGTVSDAVVVRANQYLIFTVVYR